MEITFPKKGKQAKVPSGPVALKEMPMLFMQQVILPSDVSGSMPIKINNKEPNIANNRAMEKNANTVMDTLKSTSLFPIRIFRTVSG